MEQSQAYKFASNSILTQKENQILESYDELLELDLEIALIKANDTLIRGNLSLDEPEDVSELDISNAQHALLHAKALFQIRCKVIEAVLITNPIINAVHTDDIGASVHQQDLLRLLEKRDELSFSLTQLSRKVSDLQDELLKLEIENMRISSENKKLVASMLRLIKEASSETEQTESSQELEKIKSEVALARQRWKIMKGTVSALIVGSGIDWSRDSKLLQIVLEEDYRPTTYLASKLSRKTKKAK
ncbi:hypothetical protein OnM2_017096 [Erysiphe neolycopersici]|uniref:Centromere protein H C-terminal domain-containing protein n=1 Tax=Erysiphe neolycopersici TaxID=212602 RepID=A0A420I4P8_9PEZI|nr:hypothetical protein OnM2_017096 [Erysiphe neolycopersici]